MTRDARIEELNRELNTMDDTLSGCDWCEECGGGIVTYNALLAELEQLEGAYRRVTAYGGEVTISIKYDYRTKD